MATAPRPMSESREEQAARTEADQAVWTFAVGDQTYRLAPLNLPIREKVAVQQQTGMSWEDVIRPLTRSHLPMASMAVIVWMARRLAGEPMLQWEAFAAEWDDNDLGDQVSIGVEDENGDDLAGDDPEA